MGKAIVMASSAATKEAKAAKLAAVGATGNRKQQTTRGTSQVRHATLDCKIGNSTRSVRLSSLLGNTHTQLQHGSHGQNVVEKELEL